MVSEAFASERVPWLPRGVCSLLLPSPRAIDCVCGLRGSAPSVGTKPSLQMTSTAIPMPCLRAFRACRLTN